jgi:hypothetical protein
MNRDRMVSLFLAGTLSGILLAWACGTIPGEANAQDATSGCIRWEVTQIIRNGGVRYFSEGAEPSEGTSPDIAEATWSLPAGFEPFAGGDYGVVHGRRCAD